MNDFLEACRRHKCDKGDYHRYDRLYSTLFEPLRSKPISLLEIGVYRGASVKVWKEYFPLAKITAIECDPKPEALALASDRCRIVVGKQSDPLALKIAADHGGPFDVIVDDGSHFGRDQLASLCQLWPHVRPGGLYCVEDLRGGIGPDAGDQGFSRFALDAARIGIASGREPSATLGPVAITFAGELCVFRKLED